MMSIESIIAEAAAFEPTTERPNFALAISGGSGTGKSYLSAKVLAAIGESASVLSQDLYQLGKDFPRLNTSPYRYDDPDNFQVVRFEDDLVRVRSGETIATPQFGLREVGSSNEAAFQPQRVVVVDGLYAALNGLRRCVDRSVYVEAPLYARFLRRMFRLTHYYRIPKPEVAVAHAFGPVLHAHRDFVRSQRVTADEVIRTDYSFAQTINQFGLRPVDGETAKGEIWSKAGLVFLADAGAAGYRFSLVWNNDLYSQFPLSSEQYRLLSGITDFEEL